MQKSKLAEDLEYILQHTAALWPEFKNQRILLTGGTGFIGCWLLETLLWANRCLHLNLSITCLTRDPAAFNQKAPHLAPDPALQLVAGDVRDFTFPAGSHRFIIHGAAEASAKLNQEQPQVMLDTIVQGTRQVLACASHVRAQKFLLLSSGAVYGQQPPALSHLTEEYSGSPDLFNPHGAYGIGKRTAEQLSVLHAEATGLEIKIARCFAFVGPYLPLDRHFAIGNFIRDALAAQTVVVQGDGTPYRTYQYAADLTIWLLKILCDGATCIPYNVGSATPITIAELAKLVANSVTPHVGVTIAQKADLNMAAARYVPSVQRAQQQLGLRSPISLPVAIQKTMRWHAREIVYG